MGVKKINGGVEGFNNKFVRARGGDSTGTDAATAALTQYIEATGGIISDYTDPGPGKHYRSHIFTSSGYFDVTQVGKGAGPTTVDCLLVGGGGGGGYAPSYAGSGGGAGGVHYRTDISALAATYSITIAGGGTVQGPGGSTSSPLAPFTAAGGGCGGVSDGATGGPGASSGGGNWPGGSDGPATGASGHPGGIDVVSPTPNANGWGNVGVAPSPPGAMGDGSGGGGAGSAGLGQNPSGGNPGDGGNGARYSIAYGPTNVVSYGGGGTGGLHNGPIPDIGPLDSRPAALRGGGGAGGPNPGPGGGGTGLPGGNGDSGTGGGGGGAGNRLDNTANGQGGSGIVVVRYVRDIAASTAKATGGAISYYGGKTIHTFTGSGTFTSPGTFNETVEYVAVGGGGAGGVQHGGGGGAGGYITASIPLNAGGSPISAAVVIGAGSQSLMSQGSLDGTTGAQQEGTDTTVAFPSPITAGGGGGGGSLGPTSPPYKGEGSTMPLGSGGGGALNQPGVSYDNKGTGGPQGNPGGRGWTYSSGGIGGGGGGAGGAGAGGAGPTPTAGTGGDGLQVPSTFRDPLTAPSATTPTIFAPERGGGLGTPGPGGSYYLAGGGGGAAHYPWPYGADSGTYGQFGGAGGGGHGGIGGGGSGNPAGEHAVQNTGGGGGSSGPHNVRSGSGGSGIVLIAYPT